MITSLALACGDDVGADGSASDAGTDESGESTSDDEVGETADTTDAETSSGESSETSGITESSCADGEIARGYDGTSLQCEALDADAQSAMNDNCQTYFGWRDSCNGCTEPPSKFGYANGSCSLVGGADSQCVTQALDGNMVPMLGINTDGTVNNDDKFYAGFDCVDATPSNSTASLCPAGQFVTGIDAEGEVSCADLASLVTSWANESCGAYLGWIDNCSNCTEAPEKWVYAGGAECSPGAGQDNTCVSVNVDGRIVNLAALNSDGTVDDNDTFYLSVDCLEADPTTTADVVDACPPGEFVTAIGSDGTLTCTGANALVSSYVRDNCYAYFGWRDGCDNCMEPPARWAAATPAGCGNKSEGAQCNQHGLGLAPNQFMASFGTGGEVDGNDKFYMAWTCR